MKVIKINNPQIIKFIKNNVEQILLDIKAARIGKLQEAQDKVNKLSWFGKWWDRNFCSGLSSKTFTLNFLQKHINTYCIEQQLVCERFLKKYNAGVTSFLLNEKECERLLLKETWERYPKIEVKQY